MPKSVIEPANDRVIIADKLQGTTLDGIELPENVRQQDMVFGLVIFVGPDVSSRTKVQDLVVYGPYAGKMIAIDGVEFRVMTEKQIEAYVRQEPTEEETQADQHRNCLGGGIHCGSGCIKDVDA